MLDTKVKIIDFLQDLVGDGVSMAYKIPKRTLEGVDHIETARSLQHGIFASNVAFRLAKSLKKTPAKVAEEIANAIKEVLFERMGPQYESFIIVEAKSGFVNFRFGIRGLTELVTRIYTPFGVDPIQFEDQKYAGQKVVVEFASPNPYKLMHVGHLRNIVVATGLIGVFERLGAKVYKEMVLNDKGIAVSKAMVGYLYYGRKGYYMKEPDIPLEQIFVLDYWYKHQDEWVSPEDVPDSPGKMVDNFYVKGAELVKNNEKVAHFAEHLVYMWEQEDPATRTLWQKIIDWGVLAQRQTFERLGVKFDTVWRESEHYELGKEIVKLGLARGVFKVDKKDKKGAVVANLEDIGLGKPVFLRSDGTSLYLTQDLALTYLKIQKYDAKYYYWVVGMEQSLHFKQLFEVLRRLRLIHNEVLEHVPYALMLVNGKKLSSRKGDAVHLDEFLDYLKEHIRKTYKMSEHDAEVLAQAVARIEIGKVGATKSFDFSLEEAAKLNGHTGAYLMYTYVRARNILRKSGVVQLYKKYLTQPVRGVYLVDTTGADQMQKQMLVPEDIQLMEKLVIYPLIIHRALKAKDPSVIVNYAFDLADEFNAYYEQVPVLNAVENIRNFRLYLVQALADAIADIFDIMGVKTLEKM